MNKVRKRRLKWQMMGFVGCVAVLVVLILIIVFRSMKEIIVEQYKNAGEQSVMAVAENMDYVLQNVENQTNAILLNHELLDSLKEGTQQDFTSQLNSYFLSSFYIDGIYTLSDRGYWYVGADIYGGRSRFRRDELEKTRGEIIWLPTRSLRIQILSAQIPKKYFSMGRKMLDVNSQEMLGYMIVELSEEVLREIYEPVVEEGSQIFIVDENKHIISTSTKEIPTHYLEHKWYMEKINAMSDAGSMEYQEAGKNYVALYAPLNRGNWKIIKVIPESMFYGEVDRLQHTVIEIGAGILLAVLLVGYLYFKRMTDPVTKIIRQMKKVENGDLSVRVDTDIHNEFGDLGESFNHMVIRIHQLMEEVVEAERNKKELELEVLHAQINPHFLYNTLSTIRFMAKIKGEDSISRAIAALTKLLRISISFGKDMIQLQEEISYVESYLLIQKLRFNQRFTFQADILAEHEAVMVPKLILQPIVENALIYGMQQMEESAELLAVHVYTKTVEDEIEIVVEDNGPGMTQETIAGIFREEKNINKFSKVGLNNVNQRIKLYFGEKYGVEIDSAPGAGTKIRIRISGSVQE